MSVLQFAQQMQIKRENIPPIGFIDDDLSVITYRNNQKFKQTQFGLTVSDNFQLTKKRIAKNQLNYYLKNKPARIKKANEWVRNKSRTDENYRLYLRKLSNESYKRCTKKKIEAVGIEIVREKWVAAKRNQIERKKESMTAAEFTAYNKEKAEQRKRREIEKCGGVEQYRAMKNEQARKTRANKRDKLKQEKQP